MTKSPLGDSPPAKNGGSRGGHAGAQVRKLEDHTSPSQGTPNLNPWKQGLPTGGTAGRKTYPKLP